MSRDPVSGETKLKPVTELILTPSKPLYRLTLRGVDGVHFTFFESRDVVRHPLVARIVNAYEARDANAEQTGSA